MHDPLLEYIISMAEEDPPIETEITLVVGGALITGHVVSEEAYMAHHPLTSLYFQLLSDDDEESGNDESEAEEEAAEEEDEEQDDCDDEAAFVHLRDARCYSPGQPAGGTARVYRIAIGNVSGFTLAG